MRCFSLVAALLLGAIRGEALAGVVSPPSIAKTFASPTVALGSSVMLTFTITNPNGSTDLTGVGFVDTFPEGLVLANPDSVTGSCDPGFITPAGTSVSLEGATILAGSSCSFTIDLFATSYGTKVNVTDPVTSSEGGTGNTATATVDVPPPDMTVVKTHTGNFRQGLHGATYTLAVTNSGGSPTTAPVSVTETVPTGLEATAIAGANWTCTQPAGPCSRGDLLDPGLSFEPITLTVDVANDAPGSITNTSAVSGGGETDASNDTGSDPTTVDGVALFVIPPCRAFDTRDPQGPFGGPPLAAGETRLFALPAAACAIPTSATSVAVNLTAVNPAADGDLQLYPGDESQPITNTLSFAAGKTRANNARVSIASDGTGTIAIHNTSSGAVDVLLDVSGYFE